MAELQPMEVKVKPSNVQWEYMTEYLHGYQTQGPLDRLGDEGWELVTIIRNDDNILIAYLKRIKEMAES